MEWFDIQQNTPDWYEMRSGKLTASQFGVIMANYPKAFGDPAKRLAVKIALERINQASTEDHYGDGYQNADMVRGHIQEPIARALYEDLNFCEVSNGGFYCDDFIGISPDGLVYDDGLVEIKSVIPATHAATKKRKSFDPAYKWQIIGQLHHSGRAWLDFVSYCSFMPKQHQLLVYRVEADKYKTAMEQLAHREMQFRKLVDSVIEDFS